MKNNIDNKTLTTIVALIALLTCPAFANTDLVAATLCLEAGGEGRQGMQAVMNVIANRAQQRKSSISQVVRQPKQFSCLNNISDERAIDLAKTRWPRQYIIAKELVNKSINGRLLDITGGADHYYAYKKCRPYWANRLKATKTIGKHIFLKE